MQYFKISTGKFIQFDEINDRAVIIIKSDLQTQKKELQARIGTTEPGLPTTNAEWIAYGKANFPYTDHSAEQAELDKVNIILEEIKNL